MTIYDRAAATANRMLTKYGMEVTLRRVTVGDYDPDTGSAPASPPVDYVCMGATFDYSQRDIDGSLIKTGDQKLLMSPFQTDGSAMPVPTTSDKILIGSTVYSIQPSKKVAPAGQNVLFELQIRGV
jgi:hypothetical protein